MENQEYLDTRNQAPVSVGDWVVTLILTSIPLVGFIMLLVWAFGSSAPVSKSNYAKAALIMMVIGFVLVMLFWGSIAALFVSSGAYR